MSVSASPGRAPEPRAVQRAGTQAARIALPAWVNTAAEIVKASTLLSIVGVAELLLATQEVIARSFMGLPFYFLAGAIYFAVNFGIEQLGKALERRLATDTTH